MRGPLGRFVAHIMGTDSVCTDCRRTADYVVEIDGCEYAMCAECHFAPGRFAVRAAQAVVRGSLA